MDTDDNGSVTEIPDGGHPIETYRDERIHEFLAEDKLTPEEKRRLEEKHTKSKKLKSPLKIDRS